MKALIQRVSHASVIVEGHEVGSIKHGMLILLGVEANDDDSIALKLAQKVLKYRIFSDENDKMNLNVQQSNGDILVVSQFTLVADTAKGNRPGFSKGASPALGEQMYELFKKHLESHYKTCESGVFGADMKVNLCNNGPVTFLLEAS